MPHAFDVAARGTLRRSAFLIGEVRITTSAADFASALLADVLRTVARLARSFPDATHAPTLTRWPRADSTHRARAHDRDNTMHSARR